MKKYYKYSLLTILFSLQFACTDMIIPEDDSEKAVITTNFRDYFNTFWKGMNKNYVFWDIEDSTDWDKIYKEYAPKFDNLKIGNEKDEKLAGKYFKEILSNLKDSHYVTQFIQFYGMSANDTTINGYELDGRTFSPALFRKIQQKDFYLGPLDTKSPDLYADTDFFGYLDTNNRYRVVTPDPAGSAKNSFVMAGTINETILYLRFDSFNMYQKYQYDEAYKQVLNFFFNTLKAAPSNGIKGVIFDVRQNGGGDLRDLNFLVGRFTDKPEVIGYQHYKNGDNRLDYTPWLPFYVKSPLELDPSPKKCTVPVVVLADAHSVSMAEITTMAIKALSPKNKFIGETTWGAMGALTTKHILTGGQFFVGSNQNSFTYTSSAATVDKSYKSYEGKGISPDILVKYDAEAVSMGIDKQLEVAIKNLN